MFNVCGQEYLQRIKIVFSFSLHDVSLDKFIFYKQLYILCVAVQFLPSLLVGQPDVKTKIKDWLVEGKEGTQYQRQDKEATSQYVQVKHLLVKLKLGICRYNTDVTSMAFCQHKLFSCQLLCNSS